MNILRNSLFYGLWSDCVSWFSKQWRSSQIINKFSSQKNSAELSEQSVFYLIFCKIHILLFRVYRKLNLEQALQGSLFCKPVLWCGLIILLIPFLPTMLLMAFVLIAGFSLVLSFARDSNRKLRYYPVNKFVYLFGLVYLYSSFFSVTRGESLFVGLLTIGLLFFYPILMNSTDKAPHLRILMYTLVLPAIPVSLYGFYQYLNPDVYTGAWVDSTMFESIRFRVYSTFGNPNVLGEYFLLIIPFAVALMFTAKHLLPRLFWIFSFGIMSLCLILTYSRGCYLGLLFATALFLIILDRRFLILGVVALILSPLYIPDTILQRFLSIGNMSDSSTSYRVSIWLGVVDMLKDYWFSGIGPGMAAFNKVYPSYSYHSIAAPHSHNLFLQIVCDSGICGLIVFILSLFSYYRTMFTALRREKDRKLRLFLAAGLSAISGFLVESMTDYTFYNYRVMMLFWTVLAISLLYVRLPKNKESVI